MAENNTKNQVKELTDKLEQGVTELFESDKFAAYLKTMSRFTRYSTRNTLLIHMQMPDASLVAGYQAWQSKFGRYVKKGEKGIKILAPTPFTIREERQKLDPDTKIPVLGEDGLPQTEVVEKKLARFKAIPVFDVSQTDGKPLPVLAEDLTGDVRHYELFMDALRAVSPLPIGFETLKPGTDGECRIGSDIAIQEGMSEIQTVCAVIHEITHAKLHDIEMLRQQDETVKPKDRRTEEVEAESVSYTVCQYYGIETGANSFGYLADWSKDRELKELNASLDTIRKTSAELIEGIDKHFHELAKERGIDLTAEPPAREPELASSEKETPAEAAPPADLKPNQHIEVIDGVEFIVTGPAPRQTEPPEQMQSMEHEQQPGHEEYSEPATVENAPQQPGVPSDDVSAYLPEISADLGDMKLTDKAQRIAARFDGLIEDMQEYERGTRGLGYKAETDFEHSFSEQEIARIADDILKGKSQEYIDILSSAKELAANTPIHSARCDMIISQLQAFQSEVKLAQSHEESTPTLEYEPGEIFPDPAIGLSECDLYGYTHADILPLTQTRALELFDQDMTVYMLYPDNTEGMVFEREEITAHDGIYGIDAADWHNSPEYKRMEAERSEGTREAALLYGEKSAYGIYQLKSGDELHYHRFTSMEQLEKDGLAVNRDNYELVYTGALDIRDKLTNLGKIYETFNTDRPADFTGHSVSISDVIVLQWRGEVSSHYVDRVGFKELPMFVGNETQPQPERETSPQVGNMLPTDGPTVAELKAEVDAGRQISLTDLAKAVKNENQQPPRKERPSLLAQLQDYKNNAVQGADSAKSAPKHDANREV